MARRWLIAAAVVLLVPVVVAGGVLLAFDPNAEKGRIIEAVRRATGRDLVLAGRIHVAWGIAPTLIVDDAALANMPSGSRPEMATVARLEAQVRLLPLLSRRVEIDSITLQNPDILLETDAAGHGNWQFQRPESQVASGPATPTGTPRTQLVLHGLHVRDGRLTWRDGATGQSRVVQLASASLSFSDGPTTLVADGQMDGQAAKLDARLGTQAQLSGAQPGPFPVKVTLSAAQGRFSAQGMADLAARQFDGTVQVDTPDLAVLQPFLGRKLPALRDVRLNMDGVLAVVPRLRSGALHAGASDLSALWPGATLGKLDASWTDGQPARIDADGAVDGGPWQLGSGLVPAAGSVAFRGFSLVTPAGDVRGDAAVAVDAARPPSIRGTLVSNRLDVDRLEMWAHPAPAATSAPPTVASAAIATPAVPPAGAQPLDWAALRRADMDVQLSVGALRVGGVDYRAAAAHVLLRSGVLTVDPASMLTPGGRVDLSLGADATQAPPPVQLNLRAAGLALDPLLRAAGLPGGSDASVEVDVTLHSAGLAPRDLASHVGGHVGLALVDGELSNAVLIAAMGDALRTVNAGLDPNGRSHVRCLALRLDATDGHVTLGALKLDTSRLVLEGGGTIDLAAQTLALHLRPLVRLGGAGVLAPVRLDGDIRHPVVALDPAGGTGRVGVVLGGLSQAVPADCGPDLTAARDGRAGPMPSDGPAKPGGKPADLLRKLLR